MQNAHAANSSNWPGCQSLESIQLVQHKTDDTRKVEER
jgi:hypothetical protein